MGDPLHTYGSGPPAPNQWDSISSENLRPSSSIHYAENYALKTQVESIYSEARTVRLGVEKRPPPIEEATLPNLVVGIGHASKAAAPRSWTGIGARYVKLSSSHVTPVLRKHSAGHSVPLNSPVLS